MTDDGPELEVTKSDLAGQRRRPLFAPAAPRHVTRARLTVLLLMALLVGIGAQRTGLAGSLFGQPAPTVRGTPTSEPTPTPTLSSQHVFASLALRPLGLPAVASVQACPVSHGRSITPAFGLAAGTGPLYLVGIPADGNVTYATQWADQSGWGGIGKVLWVFPHTFAGPVLVRGQRLDMAGEVRFSESDGPLLTSLQINVPQYTSAELYHNVPGGYIRANSPGCYGIQVDWLGGTEFIIVRMLSTATSDQSRQAVL